MILGYKIIGAGPQKVIVLHDWFSDCSSYDACLPYLSTNQFTYAFADVRGYGTSKDLKGEYNLDEITADIISLADHLGWNQFQIVGHSMNGMTVQRLAQREPQRVKAMVAITPVPACGSPVPDEMMAFLEDAAASNDEGAHQIVHFMSGQRHQDNFIRHKVKKWRETSNPEARVAYLHMFANTNFEDEIKGLTTPCLVLTGQHDSPAHTIEAMQQTFQQWLPNCQMEEVTNSGHYPMQEAPAYFIGRVEKFLSENR